MKKIIFTILVLSLQFTFAQPYSEGMYFDGTDNITVPTTNSINTRTTNNRTIETYFKADVVSGGKQIIMQEGATTRGIVIYIENGYLIAGAYNEGDYTPIWKGTFFRKQINANEWYHVALVLDNAQPANNTTNPLTHNSNSALKLYLNGSLVISKSGYQIGTHFQLVLGYKSEHLLFPNGTWTTQGSADYIFNNNSSNTIKYVYYFKGKLWGFRIWDNAKTINEINDNKDKLILNVGTNNLLAALDANNFIYLDSAGNPANATTSALTTKTWKSDAATTDWQTGTNWVGDVAPDSDKLESAIIVASTNNPIITSDVLVGNLTLNSGTSLTVAVDSSLDINYDFVMTGTASLTIENNGTLLQQKEVTNTKEITYKRIADNINGYDYVYWSSPVASQNINNIYNTPTQGSKYSWNTLVNNGNGASGNISQGNWENANSATMQSASGYIVRGSNNYGMPATNINATFVGIPNNGTISKTINKGSYTGNDYTGLNGVTITKFDDNYNLVGNPYPSAIDAFSFLVHNKTKLTGDVKLWSHASGASNTNANPYYGNFTYNYSSDDYITINLTGTTNNGSTIIKAGQGFFVMLQDNNAVSASETIEFKNFMRQNITTIPYANNAFFRNSNNVSTALIQNNADKNRMWLDIVDENSNSSRALVGYVAGATNDMENLYDSYSSSSSLRLFTLIDQEEFLIQGRALPFNDSDEVLLGFQVSSNGTYHIALNDVDGIFNTNQNIYLKDELLNIYHDIKLTPYTFTSDAGTINNRFKIVYRNTILNNEAFNENAIQIVKNNNIVDVISGNEIMDNIRIYDIRGRLIVEKSKINNNSISIDVNGIQNQILIVNIITKEGIKVTRKIL